MVLSVCKDWDEYRRSTTITAELDLLTKCILSMSTDDPNFVEVAHWIDKVDLWLKTCTCERPSVEEYLRLYNVPSPLETASFAYCILACD